MFDELKQEDTQQQVQTEQVETTQVEAPKVESNKEYNLRILRERAEKAEQRAAELERQRQYDLQQRQPSTPQPQQKVESNDEDITIDDESYVEGKDLKRYVRALKSEVRQTKQALQEQAQAMQVQVAEQRLRDQFKDVDQILTTENIKNLETIYPDEFESIKNNPNPYSKMKTAYTLIKNLSIAESFIKEDKKIAENKLKPRSAASVPAQGPETPLSKFEDYGRRVLSEQQKDDIMRRVQLAKSMR